METNNLNNMTTEVKAMVDALPRCYIRGDAFISKSDVIELVEKLTAWVKVEDGLPEPDKEILFKRYDGTIYFGKYCKVFKMEFVTSCVSIKNVTEWKPII